MIKAGTILDERYEIIDVVGTGGMSTVYRARDERLKRYVALKVLKSDYSNDANFVAKFRAEAQSSAGLTHPNIVSVYDVCEDRGYYYIVMELVEGITLKEYININGRLTMDQALNFAIQIASGLEAAHEHHVIHRDIKPQNIIVSKSGTIKVTDFGIAKAATSNTMSTTGMGSVHYISPEQARGGYSDERSDIYSLGITMYEMVTGKVPFEGDSNVAIALMHIQNDIIPPTELYPDIYQSFEKIILKATMKKPERRYLTAAALIADLKRVKDNPNIDIIVAPVNVSNSPTHTFSQEDIQKIRKGTTQKNLDGIKPVDMGTVKPKAPQGQQAKADPNRSQGGQGQQSRTGTKPNPNRPQGDRRTSEVVPQRNKIEELLNQNDDELEEIDDYEEIAPVQEKRPERRDRYKDDDDDQEEEVDPKLEKAVMIGGIAFALIVASIAFVLIGNVMGWFKFGSKSEKTETETETEFQTYERTTEATSEAATEATTEEKLISMLDVKGYTSEKAQKLLADAGFTNVTIEEVFDDKEVVGYVISQSVNDNEKIKSDAEIILKVSKGPESFDVPDVVGRPLAEADAMINEHFNATHAYENSDTVEKDVIISQSIKGGTSAAGGSVIKLVVSNGKEIKQTIVPNLYNQSEQSARQALENAKLVPGNVTTEFNSEIPAGNVISQSIAANTTTTENTVVDFVVSAGVKNVTYTGTVTGNIVCNNDEFLKTVDSVTVTVYITDAAGSHQVFSSTAGADSADNINVSGNATGLSYNDGSVSYVVKNGAGDDVTAFYAKNVTVTYTNE